MVSVMRDSGCTGAVVRRSLTTPDQLTGTSLSYKMMDGTVRSAPVARIEIRSPYYTGSMDALCIESPVCEVIVGNIDGVRDQPEAVDVEVSAVTTRAMSRAEKEPYKTLKVASGVGLDVSKEALIKAQKEDEGLTKIFERAEKKEVIKYDKGAVASYELSKGLLRRSYTSENGRELRQVLIPKPLRPQVLKLAHDSILTGHLGVAKAIKRILAELYWPGITSEVTR